MAIEALEASVRNAVAGLPEICEGMQETDTDALAPKARADAHAAKHKQVVLPNQPIGADEAPIGEGHDNAVGRQDATRVLGLVVELCDPLEFFRTSDVDLNLHARPNASRITREQSEPG